MNTQTHLLLAAACFTKRGEKLRNAAVVIGSLLPDLPVFALFGLGRMAGFAPQEIFDDLYFREEMRNAMGAFNSFFVVALIVLLGWLLRGRLLGLPLIFVAAAMGLHAATDLPVHVDDGHRHFWPLSSFVFSSPVSYWDPGHHGGVFSVFEAVLGVICAILVWRRFSSMWVQLLCGLAITAYVGVPLMWIWTLS